MSEQETPKKPRGNPTFKPKWIHKSKGMRFPAEFEDVLTEIARRLDHGTLTQDHLRAIIADDIERTKKAIAANLTQKN